MKNRKLTGLKFASAASDVKQSGRRFLPPFSIAAMLLAQWSFGCNEGIGHG